MNIAALKQRSEASCIATGADLPLSPGADGPYIGADSSMAIRLSADGQVEDLVKNERCAVSSGALLDLVSRMLEIPVEELGPMSLQATARDVSSGARSSPKVNPVLHPQDPPAAVPDVLAA